MTAARSPSSSKKLVLRCVLAAAGVLVVLVIGFRWWRAAALEQSMERFQAATAPLIARGVLLGAMDQERARERAGEHGTAAAELIGALDAFVYEAGDSGNWPDGPWNLDAEELDALSADDRAALTAFVAQHESFFSAVDAAAGADEISFPATRDENGLVEWAPVHQLLELRQLLSARALCAVSEDERLAAIETTLRIGRVWRPRTALEALVAAHFLDQGAADLADSLARGAVHPDAATRRLSALLTPDSIGLFPELILAERAGLLSMHDSLVDLPGVDDDVDESFAMITGAVAREQFGGSLAGPEVVDAATELVEFTEALLALPRDDHVALEAAVSKATGALRVEPESWLPWRRVRQLLGNGMASIADRGPDLFTRIDARLRMVRVALAASAYREERGEWPDALTELTASFAGGVPADPFNGESFAYDVRDDATVRIGAAGGTGEGEPDLEWIAPRR